MFSEVNAFLSKAQSNVNTNFVPRAIVCGDDITDLIVNLRNSIELGHGLLNKDNRVICVNSGVLQYRAPSHYYVQDVYRKHYFPMFNDRVVGIIEDRGGDVYKVNIFSGHPGLLPRLAFQGATKRNRPDLKKGDVVYCQVENADTDLELELTCISSSGVKKDWASGEAVFGGLMEGILIRTTIAHAQSLLRPDSVVLNMLGRHFCFEIAIGMNGIVWLKSSSTSDTIVIRNAILNTESLDNVAATACVEILLSRIRK